MYRISLTLLLALLLPACAMVPVGPSKDEQASKINVELGVGYYQQGNLELAREKLLKALSQDPDSSNAHHAFAVLLHRYKDKEKAREHFGKAIELNPMNSEALNNFAVILCNEGRYAESVDLFLRAVDNPAYRTPEVAFTSAAVCLRRADKSDIEKPREYLERALATRSDYRLALINLAEVVFEGNDFERTGFYLKRFNAAGAQTPRSLWLEIRNELELGNADKANALAEKLKADFPQSKQYESWFELSK